MTEGTLAPPETRRRSWPFFAGLLATIWSFAYLVLGFLWSQGVDGYPFGPEADEQWVLSALGGVPVGVGAPTIAVIGLIGTVVAVVMTIDAGRGPIRVVLTWFAWAMAVGLAVVVPDYRVLLTAAYTPILLVSSLFGGPSVSLLFDVLTWPVVNQFVSILGGIAWAGTALAYQRSSRGACPSCGRPAERWTTPESAARWGRWAVGVAVVVPILYAVTRLAWALGIPLGISEEFLDELQAGGATGAGAALGVSGIIGAILTIGLIRPWGEEFPRWFPFIGGKRVPISLAVIPAGLVSIMVTSAGLMFVRLTWFGKPFSLGADQMTLDEDWAALAPELLWPIWGLGLGAAALAYYYRRRDTCTRCGRG